MARDLREAPLGPIRPGPIVARREAVPGAEAVRAPVDILTGLTRSPT